MTGALGVFRGKPRPYREGEEELLIALSSQLAVAVQNARLHEQTKELGTILEQTLESERRAARQLGGLYAISQSFAESLSLDATLEAVARTMVELFDVDAAAIRTPSVRGEALETRVVHVADEELRGPVESIFSRPQPLGGSGARRLDRGRSVRCSCARGAPGDCRSRAVARALPPSGLDRRRPSARHSRRGARER